MGIQIRDDRQMKALTGLSQAQFADLLPVFSEIYRSTPGTHVRKRGDAGTRRRKPGGGSKGHLPTMPEKLQFVLYYDKTYPTFDGLATQFEMARSRANETLHKLSPILYEPLVHLELMPYREFATPADLKAALQGGGALAYRCDRTRLSALHRSGETAGALQREKNSIRARTP